VAIDLGDEGAQSDQDVHMAGLPQYPPYESQLAEERYGFGPDMFIL
jgi:hypothetical protein